MNKILRPGTHKDIYNFLLFLFFTVQPPAILFAQVKFTAVSPRQQISKNEYLQVQYIVENAPDVEQIIPPSFKNFSIISGPNHKSSMSIINGTVKQYIAIEFILKPHRPGNFTLSPAVAKVNGKTFRSNSLSVEVNSSSSGNSPGGRSISPFGINITDVLPVGPENRFDDYILYKGENIAEKINKNLFVKVEVSKTTCYVGEPIVAAYKLYTRLKSESSLTKSPSFNGFSVSEIEMPDNYTLSTEKYNRRDYSVYILRKAQLYPLQPGRIELEPIEVENHITFIKAEYANTKQGDIFYDMLRDFVDAGTPAEGMERQKITLQSKPLGIIVKPLPELNKPGDFKGAVGTFDVLPDVQKDSLTTDESGSLSIVISGKGNMQIINAPDISWPAGIESFEPVSTENIDKTSVPLQGKKIFNYHFTAAKPGKYIIPAISFSYFDIATRNYKTILTAPVTINVKQGKRSRRAISTPPDTFNDHRSQSFNVNFLNRGWLLVIAAVIILVLIVVFRKKSIKNRASPLATAPPEIPNGQQIEEEKGDEQGIPGNPLSEAEEMLLQDNPNAFYSTLNNCLRKYLSNKLSFPEKELNKKKLNELLDRHNVGLGTTLMLSSLLEKIEVNLYAPVSSANQLQEVFEKAGEVVSLLDKQIS